MFAGQTGSADGHRGLPALDFSAFGGLRVSSGDGRSVVQRVCEATHPRGGGVDDALANAGAVPAVSRGGETGKAEPACGQRGGDLLRVFLLGVLLRLVGGNQIEISNGVKG